MLDTCASAIDTVLAVYTGSAVNALSAVRSNNDSAACGASSRQSSLSFSALEGTTYRFAVDGAAAFGFPPGPPAMGATTLNWSLTAPPANDDFADAQAIAGASGSVSGTNVAASRQPGEPNHAGSTAGGASVWYRWVAPEDGLVAFDTCASGFDTLLAAYTGEAVGAPTPVAGNDDSSACGTSSRQSRVSFAASAGAEYHIAVDGAGATPTGALVLTWTQMSGVFPPANDAFAAAQAISGASGSVAGSNVNATKEVGEPNHALNVGGSSIWYSWTAPAGGSVVFDTCTSAFDTTLAAYTGTAVNALSSRASNNDSAACGSGSRQSRISFVATASTTYRIAIDGSFGATGATTLHWVQAPPPANDQFAQADDISDPEGSVDGSNVNASKEAGEPNHAGDLGGASIWYDRTAGGDGAVTFSTCGSAFDTVLAAYTGDAVDSLSAVAANDDSAACGAGSRQSSLSFEATAETVYRIAIDGFRQSGVAVTGATVLSWSQVLAAPTIAAVEPSSGPTAGGTSVTITGAGFAPGATVAFGDDPATAVTVEDDTRITATTPGGAAGTVDVVVTNPDAQSATSSDGFSYVAVTDLPGVSISDVAVTEGDRGTRRVRYDVSLSAPSSKTVKVRLSTMSGTARFGRDYQKFAATVTFEPGQTVQRVTLRIVGDTKAEGDETFILQLSEVRDATVVTPEATVTIVDDEPSVSDPR